jgi:hypothetical protein
MRRIVGFLAFAAALSALFLNSPSFAQAGGGSGALVVTACGGKSLTAGSTFPTSVDLTGNLCTSAAGSVSAAVTIANGADVALGSTTDTAWVSGAGTAIAILKQVAGNTAGATPAGANVIGKVGIDQTTPGTTNGVALVGVNGATALAGSGAVGTGSARVAVGVDSATVAGSAPVKGGVGVVNGASTYNTVAASQSAQILSSTQGGGTGAVGDYLSHCVAFPTSTTPGVVTILDNATTIFPFPGGASSVSNLVPFTIPIGAISTSGAWKITTGANISVTCMGKFT